MSFGHTPCCTEAAETDHFHFGKAIQRHLGSHQGDQTSDRLSIALFCCKSLIACLHGSPSLEWHAVRKFRLVLCACASEHSPHVCQACKSDESNLLFRWSSCRQLSMSISILLAMLAGCALLLMRYWIHRWQLSHQVGWHNLAKLPWKVL